LQDYLNSTSNSIEYNKLDYKTLQSGILKVNLVVEILDRAQFYRQAPPDDYFFMFSMNIKEFSAEESTTNTYFSRNIALPNHFRRPVL
jgi:hypothetical protein